MRDHESDSTSPSWFERHGPTVLGVVSFAVLGLLVGFQLAC